MTIKILVYVFTALLIIILGGCEPTAPLNSDYGDAIIESHRIMDSLYQSQKVPGIDVAVAVDGKIVWSEGFGYADLEHESPVIPGKTRFRIGSVSKPLTSAAIGILMDRRQLTLEEPLQRYVPYFASKKYPITVKQVGGHIAGIRHYRGEEFLSNKKFNSVRSSLTIFMDDSLLFEPGTDYSYSSYGFNLLSAVVEGASGEEFLPFIQREVFDPLDMTSTSADKNDSIIVGRSSFYDVDPLGNIINATHVDNSYKWAGGGFISTTSDLVKFGQGHLQPGFLSEETLTELTTSQTLSAGESTDYGVGWSIDGDYLGHGGGSIGGITSFLMYPEDNLVLVMLSNSSVTNYGNVDHRITGLFVKAKKAAQD